MNDNEIIKQYKSYEPFFKNWYIKRFIGQGGFGKVFEIVRDDFGTQYTSALKIITVSVNEKMKEAMRTEGRTEKDIQQNLRSMMETTVKEIQLMYKLKDNAYVVHYEDHEVEERKDGSGWDIFIKMELLTPIYDYIKQNKGTIKRRELIQLGIFVRH